MKRLSATLLLAGLALGACSGAGGSTSVKAREAAPAARTPAYTIPAACAAIGLEPGASLRGDAVAGCWTDALRAHGSVRAWTSGPPELEAEVVMGSSPRISSRAAHGEPVVVVDDTAYALLDGRWVKGVLNSEDGDEAVIAATGEFAKAMFSEAGLAQGIRGCATWTVQPARASLTLQDASVRSDLVHLTCVGTFADLGATISGAALWVEDDWTPVRSAGNVSIAGVTTTSRKDFFDHGARLDIPDPRAD